MSHLGIDCFRALPSLLFEHRPKSIDIVTRLMKSQIRHVVLTVLTVS